MASAGKAAFNLLDSFISSFGGFKIAGKDAVEVMQSAVKNVDTEVIEAGSRVGPLRQVAQGLFGLNRGNYEISSRRAVGDISQRVTGAVKSRRMLEDVIKGTDVYKDLSKDSPADINALVNELITGGDRFKNVKSDTLNDVLSMHKYSLKSLGVPETDYAQMSDTIREIGSDEKIMGILNQNVRNAGIRGQAGAMFGGTFIRDGKVAPVRGVFSMAAPTVGIGFGLKALSVPSKVLDVATEDAIRRGRI